MHGWLCHSLQGMQAHIVTGVGAPAAAWQPPRCCGRTGHPPAQRRPRRATNLLAARMTAMALSLAPSLPHAPPHLQPLLPALGHLMTFCACTFLLPCHENGSAYQYSHDYLLESVHAIAFYLPILTAFQVNGSRRLALRSGSTPACISTSKTHREPDCGSLSQRSQHVVHQRDHPEAWLQVERGCAQCR